MLKIQIFYPYEINFNSTFNLYTIDSVTRSLIFRSFQPKFYDFIRFRTLELFSGFRTKIKFDLFCTFTAPSNFFAPSLFSYSFQNDKFIFSNYLETIFTDANFNFLVYKKPIFINFYIKLNLNTFFFDSEVLNFNAPLFAAQSFFPFSYNNIPVFSRFNKTNLVKSLDLKIYKIYNFQLFARLQVFPRHFQPYSVLSLKDFFNKNYHSNIASKNFVISDSKLRNNFCPVKFKRLAFLKFKILKFNVRISDSVFSFENFFDLDSQYTIKFSLFPEFEDQHDLDEQVIVSKRYEPQIRYNKNSNTFGFKIASRFTLIKSRCVFLNRFKFKQNATVGLF